MQELSVKVGQFNRIGIADHDMSDPCKGKIQRCRAPQAARSSH
jgi:hypothetical protein